MPNFGLNRPKFWFDDKRSAVSCDCLNWKDTYAAGKVQCGQGFEFAGVHRGERTEQAAQYLYDQEYRMETDADMFSSLLCADFYNKLDTTSCARASMDMGHMWYGQNWCYVSSSCYDSGALEVPDSQVK